MAALAPWAKLALALAASVVLPTLLYLALRRSPPPRPALRLAAWSCLWAGQLLVPLGLVAWISLAFGHDVHRLGSLLAALVFGGGGAAVAAWSTVHAARLLRVGVSILRGAAATPSIRACDRVVLGSLAVLLAVAVLYGLMLTIPIPGRFGAMIYLLAILAPLVIASMLLLLVALAARALLLR